MTDFQNVRFHVEAAVRNGADVPAEWAAILLREIAARDPRALRAQVAHDTDQREAILALIQDKTCIDVHEEFPGDMVGMVGEALREARRAATQYVDVVMTTEPGPDSQFVEIETTHDGRSVRVGTWLPDDDRGGHWKLRLPVAVDAVEQGDPR